MTTQPHSPSPPSTHNRAALLEALLTEHGRELRRQARRHSTRAELSEEAMQDACVQFLRSYAGPSGIDALRWMLLTTKRCAWALGRKEGGQPRLSLNTTDAVGAEGAEVERTATDDRPGPDALAERGEQHAAGRRALGRLKDDERAALILAGLGCSYREIGELRDWTYTKVNRCMTEGRAALRRASGDASGDGAGA